jgi:hypothetical protein
VCGQDASGSPDERIISTEFIESREREQARGGEMCERCGIGNGAVEAPGHGPDTCMQCRPHLELKFV